MNEKVLMQYLQDIVNLESQKRIAGKTYNQLLLEEKDRRNYCNNSSFSRESNYSIRKNMDWGSLIGQIVAGYFIAWLIAAVLSILLMFIGQKLTFPLWMLCLIGTIVWRIKKEISKTKVRIENLKESDICYRKKVEESRMLLPQIEQDKIHLKQVYNQCTENLKKLYALNIIHLKYQYFEACGMFLEYISTGRTHSLEQNHGDTGAYNLFEQDLKFNVIKNQLEEVLTNQRILYHELSEINSRVETLSASVRNIEQYAKQTAANTRISAWCNTVTAVNVNAMRRMQENYYYYR